MRKISTNRLQAFSDGVIAIIITIMVLSIPIPNQLLFSELQQFFFNIFIFFISFIIVAAQWDKHQQLFSHFEYVTAPTIWRNIFYLFFLSLIPIFSKWVIINSTDIFPVVSYIIVYLFVGFSFQFIINNLMAEQKENPYVIKMKNLSKQLRSSQNQSLFYVIISTIILIIILLFFPTFPAILLIVSPVATSILNIFSDPLQRRLKRRSKKASSIHHSPTSSQDSSKEETRAIHNILENYLPINEQEILDQKNILNYLQIFDNLLIRENTLAHFTSSAFIVNKTFDKVLFVYHNIYQSWGWTGGHMDGATDFIQVAEKEAKEETGLNKLTLLSSEIASLDILEVPGHKKNGLYVSPHIHLSLAYIFIADETHPIKIKPDENSAINWISFNEIPNICHEPQMIYIYEKILQKIKAWQAQEIK